MIGLVTKIGTVAAAFVLSAASLASAQDAVRAELDGFQEVPAAIFTNGSGTFRASVQDDVVEYELSYAGLAEVIGAHIHFGRPGINGGVIAFLCQDQGTPLGDPPAGVQSCPDGDQTITGVLTASDVVGPADQGIAPGDGETAVAAVLARATYINVHTNAFVPGEIRGAVILRRDRNQY
jgi:hypothetical protein